MAPKGIKMNKGKRARTEQGSSSQSDPYTIRRNSRPDWPRNENTPFEVEFESEEMTLRQVLTSKKVDERERVNKWDDFNSLLYNEWLRVPMAPTRFACTTSMGFIDIRDEVMALLANCGLTKLVTRPKSLYPDLVRQFFASVQLFSEATSAEERRDPGHFFLTFLANGKRYSLSARAICTLFEFPEVPVGDLPTDIAGGVQSVWSRVGTGPYTVGGSTHADIRHPVIRYLVRVFSTTLLCKLEPGKMRKHELVLLSYALRDLVPNETWSSGFQPNMGIVFMHYLHSLRHTPLSVSSFGKKHFTVGSMLTKIFRACEVPLTGYTADTRDASLDIEHMRGAHWIRGERCPYCWVFQPTLGQSRMVTIPSVRHLLPVTSDPALLFFDPPEDLLRPVEASRRITTRGAGTSAAAGSSRATTAPIPQPHQHQHQHVFPSAPPETATDLEYRSWNTRALKAMWDILTCRFDGGCVRPRTPSPPPQPASSEHHSAEEED